MKNPLFEEHFATAIPEVRQRLEQISAEIEKRVPQAKRFISYGITACFQGDGSFAECLLRPPQILEAYGQQSAHFLPV